MADDRKEERMALSKVLRPEFTQLITEYLENADTISFMTAAKDTYRMIDELDWRQRIRQYVGPNIQALIRSTEPPRAAFARHQQMIFGWLLIANNCGDLCRSIAALPLYTRAVERIFERILGDDAEAIILKGRDPNRPALDGLRTFVSSNPEYTERVTEWMLENDAVFARVICDERQLRHFENDNSFSEEYRSSARMKFERNEIEPPESKTPHLSYGRLHHNSGRADNREEEVASESTREVLGDYVALSNS